MANEGEPSANRTPAAWVCVAVFLTALGLNLLWLGQAPLADSTEARHAEIGREFAHYGHWLVPTLDGRPHLTKPPLTDWLVAAGIKVFGMNEFGARFGTAVAAALGVALVAGFGWRLGGKRTGLAAAAFYILCPLYLALSRTISIDILVAALAAGCYWAVWELSRDGCRHPRLIAATWSLCLGLGVLAKGHIILLLVLAPTVLWIIIEKRRDLAARLAWPPAVLLFVAIGLPWYVYIAAKFPHWLSGTLANEFKHRIVGHVYGNSWIGQSVLFYLGGVLPAIPLAAVSLVGRFKKAQSPNSNRSALRLLSLWVAVPLAVFSLPKCQRANYVAPLAPAAAILAAVGWNGLAAHWLALSRRQRAAAYLTALILALSGVGSAMTYVVLSGGSNGGWGNNNAVLIVGAAAAAVASGLCIGYLARAHLGKAEVMFLLGTLCLWALTVPLLKAAKSGRSTRVVCEWINENLPRDSVVGMYQYYMPSCNFYLGRYVEMFRGDVPDDLWGDFWPTPELVAGAGSWKDLERLASRENGIWLVLKQAWHRDIDNFASAKGLSLETKRFDAQWALIHLEHRALAGDGNTSRSL